MGRWHMSQEAPFTGEGGNSIGTIAGSSNHILINARYQMDMWTKSNRIIEYSIWPVGLQNYNYKQLES